MRRDGRGIRLWYDPVVHIQNADVVLKVYARPVEGPDDKYHYQEVRPSFVHTLLHTPYEKVRFTGAAHFANGGYRRNRGILI